MDSGVDLIPVGRSKCDRPVYEIRKGKKAIAYVYWHVTGAGYWFTYEINNVQVDMLIDDALSESCALNQMLTLILSDYSLKAETGC